ncbi:MAG: sigma-70 family RNA polymerase sigma factor [Bacilli bacterium]
MEPSSNVLSLAKTNIEIRNKLIEENIDLVKNIAKSYLNMGLDYDDLVSEGLLGLTEALINYDENSPIMASYWIKEAILKALYKKPKDIISKEEFTDDENIITNNLLKLNVMQFLNSLPIKEKNVLILRYGLNNGIPLTIKQVSKTLNLTIDWTRKLEQIALNKLRKLDKISSFSLYMDNPDKCLVKLKLYKIAMYVKNKASLANIVAYYLIKQFPNMDEVVAYYNYFNQNKEQIINEIISNLSMENRLDLGFSYHTDLYKTILFENVSTKQIKLIIDFIINKLQQEVKTL